MKSPKIGYGLAAIIVTIILSLSQIQAQTVYVTKTGTKYHTKDCNYIRNGSTAIDLKDAKNKGLTACSVCKPDSQNSKTTLKVDSTKKALSTPSPSVKPKETQKKTTTVRCSATTKAGTRCSRMTSSPNGKCWQHGGN